MYVCSVIFALLAIHISKIMQLLMVVVNKIAYLNLLDSLQSAKKAFSKTSVPEISHILGKCSDFPWECSLL